MVDCAVTGYSEETADDPNFPLKTLFQYKIFPDIAELVGHGGQYDGYTPVIQGDNTGPHEERNCIKFVKRNCEDKGWHWEPQATQKTHTNNPDLSVFPSVSKRNTIITRYRGKLHILSEDKIWQTANDVWKEPPNNKIASG